MYLTVCACMNWRQTWKKWWCSTVTLIKNHTRTSTKSVHSCNFAKLAVISKCILLAKNLRWLSLVVIRHNRSEMFQEVYVVGGHISKSGNDKGNLFSVPSNKYAEFNMFLDPLAAKTVFESEVNITLIPLSIQRKASSFSSTLNLFRMTQKTPEAVFSKRLLSRLLGLKESHHRYQHMVNVYITP